MLKGEKITAHCHLSFSFIIHTEDHVKTKAFWRCTGSISKTEARRTKTTAVQYATKKKTKKPKAQQLHIASNCRWQIFFLCFFELFWLLFITCLLQQRVGWRDRPEAYVHSSKCRGTIDLYSGLIISCFAFLVFSQ